MSVKFDNYLKEQLKDPEFRKEYERLEIESKLEEVEHEAEETTVRYTSEEVIESILEEVKRHNNRAIKKKENIKYYMSLPYTYIVQERMMIPDITSMAKYLNLMDAKAQEVLLKNYMRT